MFGAIVTSLGDGHWSRPCGVTKPVFSTISTLAEVAARPVSTTHPAAPVVPSAVVCAPDSTGVKRAIAVCSATPAGGSWPLVTSTSSEEPVGGLMMLACLTAGRFVAASCGHVTVVMIWMLAPDCAAVSVALQPVASPDAFSGCASWVTVYFVPPLGLIDDLTGTSRT